MKQINNEPATDSSAHTTNVATTQPPFFRLPRELRDEIYDLVAMSEETLYCDITLREDGPSQKTTYVDRGDHRTFSKSQFEVEYSAAIEKRAKSLIAGRDRNGLQMWGLGRPEYVMGADARMVKAKEVWLEASMGPRENGRISHNIHALVFVAPLLGLGYTAIGLEHSVVFKFKFPDKVELGPRLRLDCYWYKYGPEQGENLHIRSVDDSVVQQVLGIAKGMNWKGLVREYMLWQRFIVKYVHRGPSGSFADGGGSWGARHAPGFLL